MLLREVVSTMPPTEWVGTIGENGALNVSRFETMYEYDEDQVRITSSYCGVMGLVICED